MDLTPPSISTSPVPTTQQRLLTSPPSPPESYCASEGSTVNYSSPALLSRPYNISSSYNSSIGGCSISPSLSQEESQFQSLGVMGNINWVTHSDMVTASPSLNSPSTVSHTLPAEYEHFTSYDPCLSTPFPSHESYPPPPPTSSAYSQNPPSSTLSPAQNPPIASTSPFRLVHDSSVARNKPEGSPAYPPVFGGPSYPNSNTNDAAYSSGGSPIPANIQYFNGAHTATWPRQDGETPQFYVQSQHHVSDLGQDTRPLKVPKARRLPRKHTTKEEANFQCEVKGCGKFFSRSYNYKSHLETHDEKREYPFPCPIDGCVKKFVRKTDLQRHHQSVHMKERNHKCDYCGRLFARKDTLRRHMEDGCSKRFDIGTLDLRGDGYDGEDAVGGSGHPSLDHMPQPTTALPPITMDSVPSNARGQAFETNNGNPANMTTWEK